MKTLLVVIGVIFLVIGGVLYYIPTQTAGATTTTTNNFGSNTQVSSATFIVPFQYIIASLIIGAVLLLLGLVIPSTTIVKTQEPSEGSYTRETTEETEKGDGTKRKTVTEKREHYTKTD